MNRADLGASFRSFIAELRRRKVIRAAIAYAIVGVGVAEGAALFLPPLGAPEWLPNAIAVLVVLGFPVAMGLAWVFDIVPDDEDESADTSASKSVDATRSAAQMEGQHLSHYDIIERLGVGGMGVVYKARDTRLNRIVAFKVLSDHLLADANARERFLLEARAAAALDHTNICAIHEVGETDDGRFYIAMQYYEGETLRQQIERGPLALTQALDYAAQICRGMIKAGEQGIIHRDIKPANIIVTTDGTIKILDFGLAKFGAYGVTKTGIGVGTIAYMSPEQTRGDEIDQRSDIWSLGVVLYEMLSGHRPFRGGSDQAIVNSILTCEPESVLVNVPSLPPGVVALVAKATDKNPARRYADAAAMLGDLEQLLDDPSCQMTIESTPSLPPEGERRRVTVFAGQIEGFESLLEAMDPDEVEQTLNALRDRVESVVRDYGGVLNEFAEDSFIALFGVPVTHEDDPLRAIRAALQIQQDHTAADSRHDAIRFRSAISSEKVAVRATESGERQYRIGGTVVRDTMRLAAHARDAEVLLPPHLAHLMEPFVLTEGRSPVRLRPDANEITPLAVIGESGHDSRLEASAPGALTEFVGRTSETEALSRALQDTLGGNGRFVTVTGDVGVGKSRLILEFGKTIQDFDVRSTVGRCRERGMLTPLLPLVDSVRNMLGVSKASQDDAHDRIVTRMRKVSPQLEHYLPAILHLLSIDSEQYTLPAYLEGEDLQAALGEALISVFTLGSAGRPLVMMLEDWHWADEGSREVLYQLREMVSAFPLLVIVTSRPTASVQSPMPTGDLHLELAPLAAASSTELLRASLGGATVPQSLAERINEKTGGNPFFIEELCRTLLESGALVVEADEARLSDNLERLAIPDTVQAVLKSRLDRLDPEAREVLRCASVIGRQFGLELLSRVVPSRARVSAALDTLRVAGLIQRTGLMPEPTYRFKHTLTLDVTYDGLLERHKKERHALVGEVIEELYGDQAEEHAATLAAHFAAAENWEKAIDYGLSSAKRAESLWSLPETVESLLRTRDWIDRSDKSVEAKRSLLVQLLLDLERHLETLGRRDEQQAAINDLNELLPPDLITAQHTEVCVRQGDLLVLQDRFNDARAKIEDALSMAEQLGNAELRGKALRSLGHVLWRQGDYEAAVPWLEQTVQHARQQDDTSRLIVDLLNLGRALRRLEKWDRAMAIGNEALALANETGNPIDQSYTYNYMGHLFRAMQQTDDAIAAFEKGSELCKEARIPSREAFNRIGVAAIYLETGQIEEGLAAYRDAVRLARGANRADLLAQSLQLLAEAQVNCGRSDDAVPNFEEAVAVLKRIGDEIPLAAAIAELAGARERAGLPETEATWRLALEYFERLDDRQGMLLALERLAILRRPADQTESQHIFTKALAIAADLNQAETESRICNSLALLAWQRGDLAEAETLYRQTEALLQAAQTDEVLGVVLNSLGAVLTSTGRSNEAIEVLTEALQITREYDQVSAEADSLSALGAASRASGELHNSAKWYQQCVERRRSADDRAGEGWASLRLSEVLGEADETEKSYAFSAAALAIGREIGDRTLESLAGELQLSVRAENQGQ